MYAGVFIGVLGLLAPLTNAAPRSSPQASVARRQHSYLQDDYYLEATWPKGDSVSKKFYISKQKVNPDGFEREAIVVTEKDPATEKLGPKDITIPGPKIEANYGDHIEVEVVNRLPDAGTSIHFHGIRQYQSNEMDGTPSITQCPLAPNNNTVYKWRATQYGTSWYHSHYGVQAWDGVFGPIVIHHPQSKEAEVDLGPIMLSDWTHAAIEDRYVEHATQFGTTLDNILINGENTPADGSNAGKRHEIRFQKNKTHRLRLVNTAVDTTFRVSIDNHQMEVIAADFVPIVPYSIESILISMGQRYDVIVKADQDVQDYWFRAFPADQCQASSTHANVTNGLAIVRYDEKSREDPKTTTKLSTEHVECLDEVTNKLTPALQKDVPAKIATSKQIHWDIAFNDTADPQRVIYGLEVDGKSTGATFYSDWRFPTLTQYVENKVTHLQDTHTIKVEKEDEWLQVVITNTGATAHPIHLHGHDFYILEQTSTTYDAAQVRLNTKNPPRRDVAVLQPKGYLVLAIPLDNPGAWLMHCHIGFHAAEGMNIQIAESMKEAVKQVKEADKMQKNCANWSQFQESKKLDQWASLHSGP